MHLNPLSCSMHFAPFLQTFGWQLWRTEMVKKRKKCISIYSNPSPKPKFCFKEKVRINVGLVEGYDRHFEIAVSSTWAYRQLLPGRPREVIEARDLYIIFFELLFSKTLEAWSWPSLFIQKCRRFWPWTSPLHQHQNSGFRSETEFVFSVSVKIRFRDGITSGEGELFFRSSLLLIYCLK